MTIQEKTNLIAYYTELYNKRIISRLALETNLYIIKGAN
jgi:hypothetical protein